MIERTRTYITIYRDGSKVVRVPITSSCIVVYKLMSEHYVRINFVSEQPKLFSIGDYIEDEIFGRFYIIDEQTPRNDGSQYIYELQFHAPYYRWRNRKMMMVSILPTGELYRKETVWSLTGTLQDMADILVKNVEICGLGAYTVHIEDAVTAKAAECHCLSFNGTDIITALNTFCNTDNWNCEWWVEEKEHTIGDATYTGTLHLGKCDKKLTESMEEYNFTPQRLQSMTINRSSAKYFNKLYCFGSTNNIPLTYRKKLNLKIINIVDNCYVPNYKFEPAHFHEISRTQYLDLSKIKWAAMEDVAKVTSDIYGSDPTNRYEARTAEISVEDDKEFEYLDGKHTTEDDAHWNAVTYGYRGYSEAFEIEEFTNVTVKIPDLAFDFSSYVGVVQVPFNYALKVNIRLRSTEWDESKTDIHLYGNTLYVHDHSELLHEKFSYTIGRLLGALENIESECSLDKGRYCIYISVKVVLPPFRRPETKGDWDPEFMFGSDSIVNGVANSWSVFPKTKKDTEVTNKYGQRTYVDATYFINGEKRECQICFNPKALTEGVYPNSGMYGFQVSRNGNTIISDFTTEDNPQEGKTFELTISDNDSINVPTSYYTSEYDSPFALAQVGDRRLKLPEGDRDLGGGYMLKDGYIITKDVEEADIVEEAVLFDKVYPKSRLMVDTVSTRKKRTVEEYNVDGSKDIWDWQEYALTFKFADNGEPFLFKKKYMLPGETLQVRFMTPDDIGMAGLPSQGFMLSGMTFEAEFFENKNSSPEGNYPAGSFALVQNKDFGAMLPSDSTLYPQEGDAAEVIGWNIKAMSSLGLIAKAEDELLEKGLEYIKAVNDNNVTVECVPTAQYLFDLRKYVPFYTADHKPFYTADGQQLYIRRVNEYELLDIGAPVNIHNNLFKGGVFKSRIIGFEYKLDKPYDNPKYTIGETEAYSRLRQIEKNITKLS